MSMRTTFHRFVCLLTLCLFTFMFVFQPVIHAQVEKEQRALFGDGLGYVDYNDDCDTEGAAINTGGGTGGAGIWNSGLQPPYIIEQFAIEVLKNIAAKRGVPVENAVTEEHTIALVAFMLGEGGDINNRWLFNPLNTGINAPDLIDGAGAVDGTQSFKSFDAGVEGTARTMTGGFQSRLADILTKPASTAQQFMDTLTHYTNYPGNKFWAAASLPPRTASYYAERLELVKTVRNGYDNIASIVLGTPQLEQKAGIRDKSKLKYHPVGQGAPAGTQTIDASSAASCLTGGTGGTATGGCTGGEELRVPQNGVGVATCYFNQCRIGSPAGFDWCGCGCEPTSILMIRSTFEKTPGMDKAKLYNDIKAAGGVIGCAGAFPRNWLKGYMQPLGYTVTEIHDRQKGGLSDADLAKAKEMLGQGNLILAHTSKWVGADKKSKTDGHYLVVRAVDSQGNFYVANPGTVADKEMAVSPALIKEWLDEFYAVKKDVQTVQV